MIAYNNKWLTNLIVQHSIEEAFDENCITKAEQDVINEKYNASFYTPNIFIRIGLFIVTVIIMLFSFGLMMLLFLDSVEKIAGALAICFSIFCYLVLEFIVREKKHFRSGVDDALLWGSIFSLFAGICLPHDLSGILNSVIIFVLTLYGSLRFADRLMAVVMYISILAVLFYTCVESGSTAKAIVPFIIMGTSLLVYFAVKKILLQETAIHYSGCLEWISIASLCSFYISGNYFVVRELSNNMFRMNLQPGEPITFGWLFWIFTIIVPFIYLARGIQKKDVILLRIGLLLIAAIVFTIRYYYNIMPLEIVMALGGIILVSIGYGLMKFLYIPKYGFTYQETSKKQLVEKLNIESLVLAETFTPGKEADNNRFGAGDYGGGGASGEY